MSCIFIRSRRSESPKGGSLPEPASGSAGFSGSQTLRKKKRRETASSEEFASDVESPRPSRRRSSLEFVRNLFPFSSSPGSASASSPPPTRRFSAQSSSPSSPTTSPLEDFPFGFQPTAPSSPLVAGSATSSLMNPFRWRSRSASRRHVYHQRSFEEVEEFRRQDREVEQLEGSVRRLSRLRSLRRRIERSESERAERVGGFRFRPSYFHRRSRRGRGESLQERLSEGRRKRLERRFDTAMHGTGKGVLEEKDEEEDDEGLPVDPILLTSIAPEEAKFVFTRPNGTLVTYRVESLVDYMLFSGHFCEPESNLPFEDEDLAEIDRLALEHGLDKESALEAKNNPERFREKEFQSNALVGLERCAGELVGKIPMVLETSDSREGAQIILLTELFPYIRHYFEELARSDVEFAEQCLSQYVSFVHGPKNHPTEDKHRLLSFCDEFLEELANFLEQMQEIHTQYESSLHHSETRSETSPSAVSLSSPRSAATLDDLEEALSALFDDVNTTEHTDDEDEEVEEEQEEEDAQGDNQHPHWTQSSAHPEVDEESESEREMEDREPDKTGVNTTLTGQEAIGLL